MTPSPAASSRTRAWVSGAPRGVSASIGRPSATLSSAAASTSGRSTIPAPPPAGVSSTLRCLSVAKSRMLRRLEAPDALVERPPGQARAQRPRKHLRVEGQDGGAEGHRGTAAITIHWAAHGRANSRLPDHRRRPRGPDRRHLSRPLPPRHPGGRRRQEPRRWIPCTRNHAGFPDGIAGTELLAAHARPGVQIWREDRDRIRDQARARRESGLFTATWGSGCGDGADASCSRPASPTAARRWTRSCTTTRSRAASIRYCPICDGYEVTDKKVGVIGSDSHGVAEALFIRSYTADVTLIAPDKALKLERRRPGASSRTRASTASTARPRRSRSPTTASSSTPPKAITPSTASIRRSARTPTPSSPKWSAPSSPKTAASCATPPAHQRPRPLCRGRRGPRPRPDQPRDGRRRRRRDHDPQRPLRERAALARADRRDGGSRRQAADYVYCIDNTLAVTHCPERDFVCVSSRSLQFRCALPLAATAGRH